MRIHGYMRCAILAILTVALSACAVVTIEDDSGTARVRRHFGVLEIRLASICGSATADVKAIGLTVTESSTTLGWVKGRQIVVHQLGCTKTESADSGTRILKD